MKRYIKQALFIAVFTAIAFLGGIKTADAFSINLGFGAYNYNGYGNYGSSVPVNCYVPGYGCNDYGNYNYNTYNYNTNYGNGYGNYGYGATNYNNYNNGCFYNCYTMPYQNYYTAPAYYETYPTYNYNGCNCNNYSNRNMYSSYNSNNYSTWYGY